MNWLEGFKRLKKVLIAIFIIVVVYFSWDQLQSEPWFQIERAKGGEQGYLISDTNEYAGKENEIELYFAPKVTAVANQWIANWKNTNFIFPEDKSLKEIKQMVKKNEGTDFVSILKNAFLAILGGVISIEILFWVPVYILRGFKKI